jgi:hypothetical protein
MATANKKVSPEEVGDTVETATVEKPRRRSNFSNVYPENGVLVLHVTANPKKEGSKAHEKFKAYAKADTVGGYLSAGGTYQDLAYDVGRGFVSVK